MLLNGVHRALYDLPTDARASLVSLARKVSVRVPEGGFGGAPKHVEKPRVSFLRARSGPETQRHPFPFIVATTKRFGIPATTGYERTGYRFATRLHR